MAKKEKETGENMSVPYRIVYEGGEAEIIEKKSRFIATVSAVKSEEEAIALIEKLKKKYWNATHNCSAYVIGEQSRIQRCSDDGEPSGTAGKPMLDVLLGEDVHDVVVVVTRYFGGTLLGTGGLVRAYSASTKAGLAASKVITKLYGAQISLKTDYTGLGKIQYILGQKNITITNAIYTDSVELAFFLTEEEIPRVREEIMEGTNGQADFAVARECCFANIDGEMKCL